ncbi:MAG TPA: choice-of-anchor D domain-containing protein [Conexibacter sp.]|nr:choice-of-anchor D domain-containing protein [Conexibacter sp.]
MHAGTPVHGRHIAVAAWLATLALVLCAPAAHAATDQQVDDAVELAVGWLRSTQAPDGSLGPNGGLDPAWALLGLAGADVHAADLRTAPGAPSAQDYYATLWAGSDDDAWSALGSASAADYERAILLAEAAGIDPRRIAPQQNLVAKLAGFYRDGYFTSKTSVFNHTLFGLLALERLPVPPGLVARTASIVEQHQHTDGGYASYPVTDQVTYEAPSNVDSTGAALAGLCGAGRTLADPSVAGAVTFLRAERAPSGALGNIDAASWALDGMGACGLRRGAPGWTAADETTIDWLLTEQATAGPDAGAWAPGGTPNRYTTATALQALVNPGFSATPPPRLVPGDPLLRPPATVPDGASVPVVLAIDGGLGTARLCRTSAPAGASLTAVLSAAQTSSAPAGCVSDVVVDGGAVVRIDGAVGAPGGGWRLSLDAAAEQPAGTQPVPFGALVALRLDDPLPLTFEPAALDFGEQPIGLLGAPRAVTLTNRDAHDVTVERLRLGGAHAADFALASQSCVGGTLAPGAACSASLRFAPGAAGARSATLEAEHDGDGPAPALVLAGSGGLLPTGPPGVGGAPGAGGPGGGAGGAGPIGVAGSVGAPGGAGARGPRGAAGRDGRVVCRLVGRRARRLACNLRLRNAAHARRKARSALLVRRALARRAAISPSESPRRTR